MTPARPIGPTILALDVGTTGVKAELRGSIPGLVAGLHAVASLFAGEPAMTNHHERP